MTLQSSARRADPNDDSRADFARDVLAGLSASPKRLSPKYFYDDAGCRLFERITDLPEYYLARAEMEILKTQAPAMGRLFPPGAALVEFGAGSSMKARILLRAISHIAAYVPVDIAGDCVRQEAARVHRDFPHLAVAPVEADFTQPFALPEAVRQRPRVGFFPGSTIGNFEPYEASAFLQRVKQILGADATLIVGADLVKDSRILNAAYNDSEKITAAFNLNLLTRINRELGADFKRECFEHHAFFNRGLSRVEMHLASIKRQKVHVQGETIDFRAGETIHTENSYKYSVKTFGALANGAGWKPVSVWTDAAEHFAVYALRPAAKSARAA